jgi:hypothetical protein
MKSAALPKTDSIEELARFWGSHEITAFEDQLEEVTGPIFERGPERMILRLEPAEVQAVEEIAQARGVPQAELLREWVLEKLASLPVRAPRRK